MNATDVDEWCGLQSYASVRILLFHYCFLRAPEKHAECRMHNQLFHLEASKSAGDKDSDKDGGGREGVRKCFRMIYERSICIQNRVVQLARTLRRANHILFSRETRQIDCSQLLEWMKMIKRVTLTACNSPIHRSRTVRAHCE